MEIIIQLYLLAYLFGKPTVNWILVRAVSKQDVQGMQLEAFKWYFQTPKGKLHGFSLAARRSLHANENQVLIFP